MKAMNEETESKRVQTEELVGISTNLSESSNQDFISLIVLLPDRSGRVRELTRSSRLKFKMVWHQFSTVRCHSHQLVWKVRSFQFDALKIVTNLAARNRLLVQAGHLFLE